MYPQVLFVIGPVMFIFFHINFRKKVGQLSLRESKYDMLANLTIITKQIELINKGIALFEDFIIYIQSKSSVFFEDVYWNLLKIAAINLIFLFFEVNIKLMLIGSLWCGLLWLNPSVKAFVYFCFTNIKEYFLSLSTGEIMNERFTNYLSIIKINAIYLYDCSPMKWFFETFVLKENITEIILTEENIKEVNLKLGDNIKQYDSNNIDINSTTEEVKLPEVIKFEIFENERWWVVVGWVKKLVMNERPLWSDSSHNPATKEKVFLPNNDKYRWISDWSLVINENTDPQGWEYANDFFSQFSKKTSGMYVRRRKWIKLAKLK